MNLGGIEEELEGKEWIYSEGKGKSYGNWKSHELGDVEWVDFESKSEAQLVVFDIIAHSAWNKPKSIKLYLFLLE